MFHRLRYGFLLLIPLTAAGVAISAFPVRSDRGGAHRTASSREGMVVSASAPASRAGAEILRRGGNAVDAAVATGFALAVTHPSAGNLGGGCYIVIHMADGREAVIDARETAPAAAYRNMYLDESGVPVHDMSLYGPIAAGVPGSVDGMLMALRRFGTLDRNTVLQPAVELAGRGFPLHPRLARLLERYIPEFERYPASHAAFTANGRPMEAGEIWKQPDLETTLRRISERGREGFYDGETADSIVAAMRAGGGIITHSDLEQYHAIEREPLRGRYRGFEVLTVPPSSSGGVALLQLLRIISGYDISAGGRSTRDVHLMIEAMRRVFADRTSWLGDPDFVHVPVDRLLSAAYIDSLRATIDETAATSSYDIASEVYPPVEGDQTTHYSVVDRWGNAVSVTTTINSSFGGKYVIGGTGFLLNNEMDDFSMKPGVPNQYGLLGSEANSIEPGKRMLSSMTPAIVLRGKKVYFITGSPGGSRIISTVFETIVNVVDYGMNIGDAVTAPRFHHQWFPDTVLAETGAFSDVINRELQRKGHRIVRYHPMGRVDAIMYNMEKDMYEGCSDPRGFGAAVGH